MTRVTLANQYESQLGSSFAAMISSTEYAAVSAGDTSVVGRGVVGMVAGARWRCRFGSDFPHGDSWRHADATCCEELDGLVAV